MHAGSRMHGGDFCWKRPEGRAGERRGPSVLCEKGQQPCRTALDGACQKRPFSGRGQPCQAVLCHIRADPANCLSERLARQKSGINGLLLLDAAVDPRCERPEHLKMRAAASCVRTIAGATGYPWQRGPTGEADLRP
jgi:hypothetical protein